MSGEIGEEGEGELVGDERVGCGRVGAEGVWGLVGEEPVGCWGKEDLMSLTFFSKKLAKSSGRMEEGGGGGGGSRSVLNVSNSFLGLDT